MLGGRIGYEIMRKRKITDDVAYHIALSLICCIILALVVIPSCSATSGKVIVFYRENLIGVKDVGNDVGHVGVAIQLENGKWLAGAIEGPGGMQGLTGTPDGTSYNGGWSHVFGTEEEVIKEFADSREARISDTESGNIEAHAAYTKMKQITVPEINKKNSDDAEGEMKGFAEGGFSIWKNNDCYTRVWDVMESYGVDVGLLRDSNGLISVGDKDWLRQPQDFFQDLPGASESLLPYKLELSDPEWQTRNPTDNGRIYYEPKGGVNSELDSDPPIVQAFKVTPLSVSTGESFTIDYTASDNDESGLKQVELWRKDEQRDWQEIKSNAASSEDQPISGSFTDYPSTPGKYWYGLHVVDKAGNWNDERNSNSNNPTSRFEPNEVEVKEDALLTLYVRDGNARGPIIPDAQVTGQDGAGKTFERTTDSNGYVTIKGAPGTWSFSTSANGYETNNWDQEITEACTKHAFLERYKPNQLSGAKPSDYFSILNENLWDTKWAAKGSGDKGRPAYQSRSSTSPYASQNAQPYIQPVPVAPTTTRGYGSSVIGKWLIIRHSDWGDGYKYTTFRNDGTLTSSEWYECHGTFPYLDEYMEDEWTQDGNVIRWSDSIQENFEGTLNEDTIRGVVSSPNDRNTFSAERVGTG